MRKVLIVAAIGVVAWLGYTRAVGPPTNGTPLRSTVNFDDAANIPATSSVPRFSCDGRTYCSQMTSCAEAEFFLQNCPGVKMDGNNDGEPCESQWCGDSR